MRRAAEDFRLVLENVLKNPLSSTLIQSCLLKNLSTIYLDMYPIPSCGVMHRYPIFLKSFLSNWKTTSGVKIVVMIEQF